VPVTRTYSHDGVWAYTLYAGDKPFIHALDTRDRTARCIDVPPSAFNGDSATIALRVSGDGRRLSVVDELEPVTIVDTRTFKVSTPPAAAAPKPKPAAPSTADDGGSSVPWGLIGGIGVALVLAGAAVAVAARRYAGSASPE
jgi:hypothetical protein